MSVIDILTRIDVICKKYDKYDVDKQRDQSLAANDAFAHLYERIDRDVTSVLRKAEAVVTEKNRAAAVAMKAEIRRTKARLLEDIPKLQKLAHKKVRGVSSEDLEARSDLVLALSDRILAIPHENPTGIQDNREWIESSSNPGIKIDISSEDIFSAGFYEESEESSQFKKEYDMRKRKQDEGLDIISSGLDRLKDLAVDMNEELDKQVPLVDEIDTKVDKASSDLKNTNVRLKENLNLIRSSRNFLIDIILLCIILGIASYLYNVLH